MVKKLYLWFRHFIHLFYNEFAKVNYTYLSLSLVLVETQYNIENKNEEKWSSNKQKNCEDTEYAADGQFTPAALRPFFFCPQVRVLNVNLTAKRHRTKIEHDEPHIPSVDREQARPHRGLFCKDAKSEHLHFAHTTAFTR